MQELTRSKNHSSQLKTPFRLLFFVSGPGTTEPYQTATYQRLTSPFTNYQASGVDKWTTVSSMVIFFLAQQNEFLYSFARVDLTGIEIALRVRDNLMHPVELAGISPVMSSLSNNHPIVAAHSPNNIVFAIGKQEKFLMSIGRKRKLPDGTHP